MANTVSQSVIARTRKAPRTTAEDGSSLVSRVERRDRLPLPGPVSSQTEPPTFGLRSRPSDADAGFIGAAAGVILAALSRLYLGYHWLSDALASVAMSMVLLGAVIALGTWRTARIPGEAITGGL